MKLKKIASLALAGIMAVSMLAGCKDGGNGNSGSSSSEQTTATGIVATVDKAIKDYNSGLTVTVKESGVMNTRLEKLFKDYVYSELTADNYKLIEEDMESVFNATNWKEVDSTSFLKETYNPGINANAGTYHAWMVLPVEKVSSATAQVKAANAIAEAFDGVKNTFASNVSGAGKTFNNTYTLYVSQLNATKPGDSSVPVVVAVLEVKMEAKL